MPRRPARGADQVGPALVAARAARAARARAATASVTRPTGTLTRNTQRQLACTSRPPSGGPAAAATPPTAAQSADRDARCAGGNSGSSSPSEVGSMQRRAGRLDARARPRARSTEGAAAHERGGGDEHAAGRRGTRACGPIRSAQPPAGHQQRGEDDRVGVQHPGEPASAAPPKSRCEVGEGDVDDEQVEAGHEDRRPRRRRATSPAACGCMMKRTVARASLLHATHSARLGGASQRLRPDLLRSPRALEVVGERWTMLDPARRLPRRAPLRRTSSADLGIARNVLAARLDRLVARGRPRAPALLGAPAALRVRPHRQGPRPVAGARRADAVGRPHGHPDGAADGALPPRLRRRGVTPTAPASAAGPSWGHATCSRRPLSSGRRPSRRRAGSAHARSARRSPARSSTSRRAPRKAGTGAPACAATR